MRLPIVLLIIILLTGAALVGRFGLSPAERELTRYLDRNERFERLSVQALLPPWSRDDAWSLVCVRGPYGGDFRDPPRRAASPATAAAWSAALVRINDDLARHDPVNAEGEWEIFYGSADAVEKVVIDSHQVSFEVPEDACVSYPDAYLIRTELTDYPYGTGLTLTTRSTEGQPVPATD
jgi:hypothetical protein